MHKLSRWKIKMPFVHSVKSPRTMTKKDSLSFDNLFKHCENLLRTSFSTYDDCFKLQEKLRLLLVKHMTNKEYKFLKIWLEKAEEDYLKMESNNGDLKEMYEVLLKNNFAEKFYECEVTLGKLQLKFFKVMNQCKDLKTSLSTSDNDIKFLKSHHKEFTSEEYSNLLKTLRLKSLDAAYECERLNGSLNEACEEIVILNSEYDNLIQRYKALSQDTIVAEFLDYAIYLEKFQNESDKMSFKCKCLESSRAQSYEEEVASFNLKLNELQKIAQQFTTNIELMRNSIRNSPKRSNCNTIPGFSLSAISEPNNLEFKEEIEMDYHEKNENEDFLGQTEDPFSISRSSNEFHLTENTEKEKANVSLDSGIITAVRNSSEHNTAGRRKKVLEFCCDSCPGRYMSEKSLMNHKLRCHDRDEEQSTSRKVIKRGRKIKNSSSPLN